MLFILIKCNGKSKGFQESVYVNGLTVTRKQGKALRVARPACANATVHFFTYLQTSYATAT